MATYRVPTSDGPVLIDAIDSVSAKSRVEAGEGILEVSRPAPLASPDDGRQANEAFRTPMPERPTTPGGAIVGLDPRIHGRRTPEANAAVEAGIGAIGEAAKPAVLPMAGGLLGGAAGGLLTSPTVAGVPAGVIGGEALGAAAGEAANQALGITPRSGLMIGVSGAAGPAARVAGGLARGLGRHITRASPSTAIALQEEAVQSARTMGPRLIPQAKGVGSAAERALDDIQGGVRVSRFQAFSAKLEAQEETLKRVAQGLENPKLTNLTEGIAAGPVGKSGVLDFQEMRLVSRRLGQRIGSLEGVVATDGAAKEQLGAYRGLFKALQEDVDAMVAASPGPSKLRQAHALYKRELAQDRFEELTKQAIQVQEGSAFEFIQGKRLLKGVQEDPIFKRALSAEEYRSLEAGVKELVKTPRLPPPEGTPAGSMQIVTRLGEYTTGGAIGGVAMGNPAAGSLIGAAVALGAPKLVSLLMLHPMGRQAMLNLARGGFTLDTPHLARIAIATRAVSGPAVARGAGLTP